MNWADCEGFTPETEICCLEASSYREEPCAEVSGRSRLTAALLVLSLGQFGAHRFYAGKTQTAISMLLLAVPSWLTPWYPVGWFFLVTLVIWILIDSFLVISGQMKDARGNLIKKW